MLLEEHIQNTETKLFKMVFPGCLNDNGILFGGLAMQWMDEAAYITAQRFTRMKMVTVSVKNINFLKSVHQGSILEITGRVVKVGGVKIDIRVEVHRESTESKLKEKVADALFTFASINPRFKPVSINLESCLNS